MLSADRDRLDHDHTRCAGVAEGADRRYLRVALGLIVGFMAAEVAVALVSGSLALLADAGHMLTDAGAIGGSIWALNLAQRPASNVWSYGLKRAEIIAPAAHGVTLLVVGVLVGGCAAPRLRHPSPVQGLPLVVRAV